MIKKLLQVITLACLLLISSVTHSQVTIGKAEKPAVGALLDLKNLDTPGLNGETANKGLMLPRVELSDVSKLYPMLPSGYDIGENAKHNGLVVFNMGTGDVDLCIGIYVWDSQKWNRIPEPCNNSLWSTTNLLFYKSALAAKSITLDLSRENAKVTWAHDSAIPWLAGGFPQNDTRKITKTFTFQPQPNVAGADLTSNVTATVNSDGKVSTETITITQLNREMTFATPATVLPAVGAEHSLNVDSEADWTALVSSTNPGSMITAIAENTQLAGNSRIMKVTLDNNNTWAERIAKLDITSTNPDFLSRTVDVKQTFVPPSLAITAPVGKIIDFGEVTGSTAKQSITFAVNSSWQFTTDAQYANVISASTVAGNTITAGGVPTAAQTQTVTLTPNGTNTAIGGTPYETKLTFTTANTGTQPAKTELITVKRKVPFLFTAPTLAVASGTVLTRAGHTIGMTTNTNRAWWVRQVSSTTTTSNMAANAYASRSLSVAVPANDLWTARTGITLGYSFDGSAYTNVATYSQAPYDLAYSAHTALTGAVGGKVARTGKSNATVTLRSNGGHPTTGIHMTYFDQYGASQTLQFNSLAGVANPNTEALKNRVYTTAIPANYSWAERTYTIHFLKNAWVNTGVTFTQHSYDIAAAIGSIPATLPYAAGSYYAITSTVNGCPPYRMGISFGNANGQPSDNWAWLESAPSSVMGHRYFLVPETTITTPRTLYFWVERPDNTWLLVASRTQAGQPWLDAGGWWVHDTPIAGGTVGQNMWVAIQGEEGTRRCVEAYGAGWGAVVTGTMNTNNGTPIQYPSPAYGARAGLTPAQIDKIKAPKVHFVFNFNYSSGGNFTGGSLAHITIPGGFSGNQSYSSLAQLEVQQLTIICAKPK